MNKPEDSEWLAAIKRLHERLDQAEIRQRLVMDDLRFELSILEKQIPPTAAEVESIPAVLVVEAPVAEVRTAIENEPVNELPPPLPAAFTTPAEPAIADASFEQKFGQIWLVRIGMVLLLTGLVLGANWAYRNWIYDLSAGARLMGLYLCAALLGGCGILVSRKEHLRRYGEVLLAGGLAFFYYCTYAAHHVSRLRVIESPVAAASLLLAAAGVIAAVSWFRKSQGTAVMGILLASYATMIQPLDWLSAISNLLLAAMGVGLMLRPGWKAPGIASLTGTYGAFCGWQLLGAAGSGAGDSQATLWFLCGSWGIFAIPGMLGHFRESLGERGRALFTAANNGLFFSIFSWLWIGDHGTQGFWKVAAVFGGVLLIMGVIGRKRADAAAASNVTQGLAALSLALVLKFEGYHLCLALAGESFALALAFHRFRKSAEFSFALLAGMGAAVMALCLHSPIFPGTPAWSGGLSAVLVAMAALLLRYNVDRAEKPTSSQVRSGASLLFYGALAILLVGWCLRLEESLRMPVIMALAAVFAIVYNMFDRRRWLPEVGWASGVMGIFSFLLLRIEIPWMGYAVSLIACLVACWAWHLPQKADHDSVEPRHCSNRDAVTFAWLFAVLLPLIFYKMLELWQLLASQKVMILALGAVGFVGIARMLKTTRIEITASMLNVASLGLVLFDFYKGEGHIAKAVSFVPAVASVALLRLIHWGRDGSGSPQALLVGICFFVAWPAALLNAVPEFSIDLLAASAALGFVLAAYRGQSPPIYCWGWTVVSIFCYTILLLEGNSSILHGYQFEGILLVILLGGIAIKRPQLPNYGPQATVECCLSWLACIVLSIWATHISVDIFGWKSSAVLWTTLGFGLVSFGLLGNRITSRQAGFLLLTFALAKLFLVDVWDFAAFARVISFVALGLALVVLGLFYHRFAPVLKRMIDSDETPASPKNPVS